MSGLADPPRPLSVGARLGSWATEICATSDDREDKDYLVTDGEPRTGNWPSTLVRRATSGDVPLMAEVLARAMEDDPEIRWMFPRSRTRGRVLPQVFAAMILHLYLPFDEVFTTDDYSAAALWLPPSNPGPAPFEVMRLAARMALLFPLAGRALWRAPAQAGYLNARRPREPHYYLALLGTDPRHQGQGIGSAMLSSQLARCDAEGFPAYLESSNRRNLGLYSRHGFEVMKELKSTRHGLSTWLMWREPHT